MKNIPRSALHRHWLACEDYLQYFCDALLALRDPGPVVLAHGLFRVAGKFSHISDCYVALLQQNPREGVAETMMLRRL
jgi:hypothetical protein